MAAVEHRSPAREPASPIPVIDVGGYLAGAPGSLEMVAGGIRHALENVGFFVIVNHDVPRRLIARTFEEARRIHALPSDVKMSLRMNEHNNGYMAMARYTVRTAEVNAGAAPDLNEAFFVKRERAPDDPLRRSGRRFVGPNVWPDGLPGFRENVLAHTDAMDRFGRRMLPAVATALDLPPGRFDTAFEESRFSFRLSHYPPVTPGENQFGIAPHTDVNFMTFLPQSEIPGLEVLLPSGEWAPVPEIPDSFAVNSGDTLHRWTNGRFRSTAHRARPPAGTHRYAIPFFLGPHVDTLIECLPTCLDAGPTHMRREDRRALATVSTVGRFESELLEGDLHHVESGFIGCEGETVRTGHKLFESASGRLCAAFTVAQRYMDLDARRSAAIGSTINCGVKRSLQPGPGAGFTGLALVFSPHPMATRRSPLPIDPTEFCASLWPPQSPRSAALWARRKSE